MRFWGLIKFLAAFPMMVMRYIDDVEIKFEGGNDLEG